MTTTDTDHQSIGVTAARGFRAAGVTAGIKASGRSMAFALRMRVSISAIGSVIMVVFSFTS